MLCNPKTLYLFGLSLYNLAQAGVVVTDGESVKATYAHKVDASQTVGGEVVKNLAKETTAFTLGYSKRMDSGATFKARLNNAGARLFVFTDVPAVQIRVLGS